MTREEEKYQEIVNSRKNKEAEKQPETPPQETTPSGVKTDPPAERQPEPGKKPDESKPQGDGKQPEDPKGEGTAKPSEKEMQEHAFAKMRLKFKKENEELKARLAQLEKSAVENAPKTQLKTRKDFETDPEYEQYVRDSIADEVRKKVLEEVNSYRAKQDEANKNTAKLREDLEGTFGKEVTNKVLTDLNDPESEMSMILTDERAAPIVEAVKGSGRKADLLALMQAKPQIFQAMMTLPPTKMAYRVYQLEDQIEAKYSALAAKKKEDEKKKAIADSLPTPGSFGNGGEENKGVSGLSTQQRVDRYKKEYLEQRIKH